MNIADTVVPGRIGYLVPLDLSGSANSKSPTLIILDKRPNRPKKSIRVEVRPVCLHFERHFIVKVFRHDRLRCQPPKLNVGGACCTLQQADEFIRLFFFRNDGFKRVQLLRKRIHLLFSSP